MLYNNRSPRIDWTTIKAIETNSCLILDSVLYDKKTLTQISNKRIDIGWENIPQYSKNIAINNTVSVSYNNNFGYQDIKSAQNSMIDENQIIHKCMSIVDNQDSNIEWTVIGGHVIKINTNTKDVDIFNNQAIANYTHSTNISETMFLWQDDDYIYFLSHENYTYDRSGIIGCLVLNKSTGTISNIAYLSNTQYDKMCQKLYTDHLKAEIYLLVQKHNENSILYKLACANGTITTTTQAGFPAIFAGNSYSRVNNFTKLDDNNLALIFQQPSYNVNLSPQLLSFKFDGATFIQADSMDLWTDSRFDVDDYLRDKYSVTDSSISSMTSEDLRKKFFKMPNSSYRGMKLYNLKDSDDKDYIVMSCFSENNDSYAAQEFIAVFIQTDPENDPLAVKLVNFEIYADISKKYCPISTIRHIYKLDEYQLIAPIVNNGVLIIDLNPDGSFKHRTIMFKKLVSFGYDSFKRVYLSDEYSNEVQIFSRNLPHSIELEYVNEEDAHSYIEHGQEVTKKFKVRIKNVFGELVTGNYQLHVSGKAMFKDSQSTVLQGVAVNGLDEQELIITGPTTASISKKLLYNNELEQ